MSEALLVVLGASLAIISGFLVNYIDYLRKKGTFIRCVIHEMNLFIKFVNELGNPDASSQSDWLGINVPNLLIRINTSRSATSRNNDWFLVINSDELLERVESFYFDTNVLVSKLTYLIQRKSDLLNQRASIIKQLYGSGLNSPEDIQKKLAESMPIELGFIDEIEKILVNDLQKLINYQAPAQVISHGLKNEYPFWIGIKRKIKEMLRCSC